MESQLSDLSHPGRELLQVINRLGLNELRPRRDLFLEPDDLQFSVFYPYPMTELHDVAVEKGYFVPQPGALSTYYARASVLNLPTLTPEELAYEYDRFLALKNELSLRRTHPWKYRKRVLRRA